MPLCKPFILMFVVCLLFPTNLRAGVTTIQPLSFGNFVVKRNDAQYDITINTDGSVAYDSAGYIQISPPQQGIYDIDGLPLAMAISSVDVTQFGPLSAAGNLFQMVDFQETHPAATVGGVARIVIGATARSTGNGIAYFDQTYTGTVQIQINF